MSNINDFGNDGVRVRYIGSNEEKVIPCGYSIPEYEFMYQRNITDVTISNPVTSIGHYAFQGCDSLSKVTISDGVKSIGHEAFSGCSRLKSVTIPDSLIYFDEERYKWNDGYIFPEKTVVIFSNYIKDIEKRHVSQRLVFCKTPIQEIKSTNAKDLAVKGFLTVKDLSVYDDAVIDSYKKYLKTKSVNYVSFILENDADMIIRRLESLDIIDSKLADKLMEYDLSEEAKASIVDSIKESEKTGGNKKSSTNKGPSVTELKKIWSFKKSEDGITITSYKGLDTKIVIPDTIGKDSVTEIGEDVFCSWKKGLTEAQKHARNSITDIKIPDTVTAIGGGAFSGCVNLSNITIPGSVTSVSGFSGCKSLSSIVIPDSVTTIAPNTFRDCSKLSEIKIPNSVTRIGSGVFRGCSSLASVTISNNVKEIESSTFAGCRALVGITIPNGITCIDSQAFVGCESLARIIIPDSVKKVGRGAFENCRGLTEIIIPDNVEIMEGSIFWGCINLKRVVLPKNLKIIPSYLFINCRSLTDVIIPDSIEMIEPCAFKGCSSLTNITIPQNVNKIGREVFDECSNLTIHATAGSLAEEYAKENSIPFEAME